MVLILAFQKAILSIIQNFPQIEKKQQDNKQQQIIQSENNSQKTINKQEKQIKSANDINLNQNSNKNQNRKANKKDKLYDISPKGWLRTEDKTQQIMFQKGMELDEFLFVHQMVLGYRSDLNNLKILEVVETTRKDPVGGDLQNLDQDFHHMYLILKCEETLLPDTNDNKNRVKKFENYMKHKNLQKENQNQIQQNNKQNGIQQDNKQENEKRLVWVRLEYLRQSKVQIYYALKYGRVPQDFGKLLRIRQFQCQGEESKSLEDVLTQIQIYQNKQEFDAWEHNCQKMIKKIKLFLDLQEI